ncbi:MAG TPA: 3-isopropylmalate dehydratase small subunit [Clostridia bacterium]|nr:3-isopropylmalate dehydratase small subunit [Clostridia bacterium]
MELTIKSSAIVYNHDDISTDQIFPGKFVSISNPPEIVEHILEGADVTLRERFKSGNIFVVGENFGCGSSREQAVIGIKEAGIKLVIASSAGRIWYRNAINLALPVIFCPGASNKVAEGDELQVNLKTGIIKNITKEETYNGEPLSDFIMNIFENGGIKQMMLNKNSNQNK